MAADDARGCERWEAEERIPVARPRPTVRPAPDREGPRSGSDAGLALIGIAALVGTVGWLIGRALGVPFAGAMVGGLVGVIAGFAAVYVRFRQL